jgi:Fe-S cluster assembly ATP-binding protein
VRGYKDRAREEMERTGQLKEVGSELMPMREFRQELFEKMDRFNVDRAFARRYLNDGFSGGEKKRGEVLQMAMLQPKIAILDESDSGLDIDALRVVSDGINKLVADGMGALLITHYQRILDYVKPDQVSVFYDGRVVLTGGPEVAEMLEEKGYGWVEEHLKEIANG